MPATAPLATLTASTAAGTAGNAVPGAYISNMYQSGAADFTAQSSLWTAISGTTIRTARYYKAASDFTLTTDMSEMITAGVKICLTLRPAFNPVSSADLSSMTTLLQAMKTAGARADIALWHEPFFSGLTSTQFTAMISYYGPTVRSYFPLVFVGAGNDLILGNGYYPGDSAVDKIAADQYAFGTVSPDPGVNIDNAAAIADAASPRKPLGLWEFNGSTDAVNGQSQSLITAFFGSVQAFFSGRITAGKPNADIILFDSGTGNFLGFATSQLCGFEGGISTWGARSNCTVAASSAQAYEGSGSLAMTATSTSNMSAFPWSAALYTHACPCAAGNSVTVEAQFRAATAARNVFCGIDWYSSSGTLLSTSFGTSTAGESTAGWFHLVQSFTAPASAAFAVPVTFVAAPAGSGEVHYVDNAVIYVNQASGAAINTTIWSAKDYRVPLYSALFAALNATPAPAAIATTSAPLSVLTAATAP